MGNAKINIRRLEDITPLFSEDYKRAGIKINSQEAVYYGIEYSSNPKPANITVIPNIVSNNGLIFGSTFGHQHILDDENETRQYQEIYEFMGFGAMLLRRKNNTRLHILRPLEKVLVGTHDNMTIFNLDNFPLLTFDYANTEKNKADKNKEKSIGTMFLICFNGKNAYVHINRKYYEHGLLNGDENISPINIENTFPGERLYTDIQKYKSYFNLAGIDLIRGGNLPEDFEKEFQIPLAELILKRNKKLLMMLGI